MQTKASAKFIKMSPRKVRLVVDNIRGMKAEEALDNLRLMNKAAARPVAKLINSAVANAEHNFELVKDNLFIKEITVDEGPTLKRWLPRAHGRATPLRKRMSHISLILAEIKDSGEIKGRKPETGEIVKLGAVDKKLKPGASDSINKKKETAEAVDKVDKLAEIKDPRRDGRQGHDRQEGGRKGFASRIFRRKSG